MTDHTTVATAYAAQLERTAGLRHRARRPSTGRRAVARRLHQLADALDAEQSGATR